MATETQRASRTIEAPASPAEQPVALQLRSLRLDKDERRGSGRRVRWLRMLLWLGVTGGVIVAAGLWANSAGYFEKPPVEVDAVVFGASDSSDVLLDLTGYLAPRRRINVSPRVGGYIVAFPCEAGQRVKKGDLLVQIDDRLFKAEVESAKATLAQWQSKLDELQHGALPEEIAKATALFDQAKHQLDKADQDLKRAIATRERSPQVITDAEMTQRNTEYRSAKANAASFEQSLLLLKHGARPEQVAAAEAQVEQAQALLRKAEVMVDNARLVAPHDATVIEKNGEEGEGIHPEVVIKSLCVLADLSDMEAEVEVQETDLQRIAVGDPCRVIPDAYENHTYDGQIVRILPLVNKARGTVVVKVRVLNPDEHLLVDMNCRVLFVRKDNPNAAERLPRVPKRAVVEEEGTASYVYVLDGLVARRRNVELGASDGEEFEIKSGLQKGEIVLMSGAESLTDGRRVRPPKLPDANAGGAPAGTTPKKSAGESS
ncbi:MAG: efflux RND transporter periplasmic adaptor subunit [Pirellulales bacterium]|nr:efflux RND transporter periplasmic adaptor subunit [Pirellulales bacterium]